MFKSAASCRKSSNPSSLEHCRPILSKALAEAQAVFTVQHNTPYGDIVDSEEDLQIHLYDAVSYLSRALEIITNVLATMQINKELLHKRAGENFITATELADTFVREGGLTFRKAHKLTSTIGPPPVCRRQGRGDITEEFCEEISKEVLGYPVDLSDEAIRTALDPVHFVAIRDRTGGPALSQASRMHRERLAVLQQEQCQLEKIRGGYRSAHGKIDRTGGEAFEKGLRAMKLGIDVGGTKTKVAVLDDQNHLVEAKSYSTVTEEQPFLKFLTDLIWEKLRQWPLISQIGIGIPGTVDTEAGVVVWCPALKVENFALCRVLQQSISLPVCADNDVNAWALAEGVIGSCQEETDYVLVTVGTGIGAGIVLNGSLYRGSHFGAGEIGYMVQERDLSTPCPSRREFGAFERRASAIAVSNRYREKTGLSMDTREIFRLAQQQEDPIAKQIVGRQIDALSVGLANIICLLQPSKIVIGGGLANEGEYLLDQLQKRIRRLIPGETPIVLSDGGKWGGAIGAALMASTHPVSIPAACAEENIHYI